LIGSAYGYSDRQLEHGRFHVDYVDVYAEDARRNARRRAIELCVNAGFGREIDFSPKTRPLDDLLMVDGIVQCRTRGQTEPDQQSEDIRIRARIAEIDAELLAYERRAASIQDAQSNIGNTGVPFLNLLDTVIGGPILNQEKHDTRSRIIELEAERHRLQTELLALDSNKTVTAANTGRAHQQATPSTTSFSKRGADTLYASGEYRLRESAGLSERARSGLGARVVPAGQGSTNADVGGEAKGRVARGGDAAAAVE